MQKLLIATTNKGKFNEIKKFLGEIPFELVSLSDVGITQDVEETGDTYEENSRKKAVEYAEISGLPAVSDDGGFEIEALGGIPGVQSKYWAGENFTEGGIVGKMSEVAKTLPKNKRGARFVAVETLALPTGKFWQVREKVEGIIPEKPKEPVPHGLPYRSFFFIPQLGKYYSEELTPPETKEYNHRYKAVQSLKRIIEEEL